ncbi:hypothetical protein EV182_005005 [Spiromyces aspiralis]|uniref:Uncharacterized protein n=1 Tax=Spiromyces aspiralis TaxID=68401 RepID=A0ACC1HE02_9FUNG|nr:hypothetical protein EV182_005005 [Spiromyces aspiralis]
MNASNDAFKDNGGAANNGAAPATTLSSDQHLPAKGGYARRLSEFILNPGFKVVVASTVIQMFTTSIIPAMGIFQAYYLEKLFPDDSATRISWISTTSVICLFGMIVVGGVMFERIGPIFTCATGTTLMVAGYMLASLGKIKIWQLVLCQGLLVGTGAGLLNSVAIIIPLDYYEKRQGLALSIASTGAGIGGIWIPPLVEKVIERHGIGWALRMMGFMVFFACSVASAFQQRPLPAPAVETTPSKVEIEQASGSTTAQDGSSIPTEQKMRRRKKKKKQEKKPWVDPRVFLDPTIWLLFLVMFFMKVVITTTAAYIVTSAIKYGVSSSRAALLTTVMAVGHIVGNVVSGYLVDKVTAMVVLISSFFCGSVTIFALWYPATSYGMFMAFSALYSLFGMNTNNALPVLIAQFFGLTHLPTINGVVMVGSVFGGIFGNLAVARVYDILDHRDKFKKTILLVGSFYVLALLLSLAVGYMYWQRYRRGQIHRVY